jgi:MFS family permease
VAEAGRSSPPALGHWLPLLVAAQIGLHATMAGVRLAAPLQALRTGHSALAVGVLLSLYALAPVLLSLAFGRMADRHGYHRPVRLGIGLALGGALLAAASTWAAGGAQFALLALSAALVGSGANLGLIVGQRSAALAARDGTERMRVFSWLGIAPALSNVVGPVLAGFVIDAGGFRAAYLVLALLPVLTLVCIRRVRALPLRPAAAGGAAGGWWALVTAPGLSRLLGVNLLLAACWDVHLFAVPVLGHERGYAAATIGLILGSFTLAMSGVRLLIPLVAHRLQPVTTLRAAMVGTGIVFGLYPLAQSPWLMGACAVGLGLTLGAVQPMIMATLHLLTPHGRHGEAIALRSLVMNLSSTTLPLLFGAAGATVGAAALFWLIGGAVAGGSWFARRLPAADGA